jgi:hypothetical protein
VLSEMKQADPFPIGTAPAFLAFFCILRIVLYRCLDAQRLWNAFSFVLAQIRRAFNLQNPMAIYVPL